jgi:hypothetical protein
MKSIKHAAFLIIIMSLTMINPVFAGKNPDKPDYRVSENTFVNPGIKNMNINSYLVFPAIIRAALLHKKNEEMMKKSYEKRNADKIELLLLRLGYNCIDRSRLNRILAEQKLSLSEMTAGRAKKMGKLLVVDAVVIVTILDMGWFKDQNMSFTHISVEAVSVQTGSVIWKTILKGTAVHDDKMIHSRIVVDSLESRLYRLLEDKLRKYLE